MKHQISLPSLILLIICLTVPATAVLAYGTRQPVPQLPIQTPNAYQFNGTNAYQLLIELTRDYPKRVVGTAEGNGSASWIATYFQRLNLTVNMTGFPTEDFQGQRVFGTNVYAVSQGSSETAPALILLAHRDVHPQTSEGANDNGSGTVALMELARVLTRTPRNLTYYFLSTDSEETNLGGSAFFAEHVARGLRVKLALSMDVIGYKHEQALLVYAYNHLSRYTDAGTLLTASRIGQELSLPSSPQVSDQLARRAGVRLFGSDSESFVARGIESYSIADPTYPYAHTASDSLHQISASRLEAVGRWVETLVYNLEQGLNMPTLGESYLIYEDGYSNSTGILLHLASYPLIAIALPTWLFIRRRPRPTLLSAGTTVLASFLIMFASTLLPIVYLFTGLWPPVIPQLRLTLLVIYLLEVVSILALFPFWEGRLLRLIGIPGREVEPQVRRVWTACVLSATFLLNFAFHPYAAILLFALPTLLHQAASALGRGSSSLRALVALLAPMPLYAVAILGALLFGLEGVLVYLVALISSGTIFPEIAAGVAVMLSSGYALSENYSHD